MTLLRRLLVAVLVLVALVACSGGSDDAGGGEAQMGSAADHADADAAESAAQVADGDREVITTGSLTLVVDDAVDAVDDVVGLVEAVDGRIDQRSQQRATEHSPASAWLTARVPSGALQGLIADLEEVGEVTDVSLAAQDVTREAQDLDARIEALQASTDRLLELMTEAADSESLLAAEGALSERQADLESLQSQRAHLSDQVAMSTLDVSLVTAHAVELETAGFLGGVQNGWDALIGFASGLLVVVGTLLPWLAVVGVPVAVVLWLVRSRRQRGASAPAGEGASSA